MMSMQYKSNILCTEETKMCKLTNNLLVQGGVGFSGFRGKNLTSGEGEIQGVESPVGAMLWNI